MKNIDIEYHMSKGKTWEQAIEHLKAQGFTVIQVVEEKEVPKK